MTKKAPKPTPAHMQKLADLMDTRPEGVSLRQVQNTLSVSPTLAKAALIEIGATEVEGKWAFAEQDDATLEEIGNFVSQPKVDKPTQAEIDACSDTCTANICGALNVCFMDKAPVEPEPVCTKSDFALALEAERQRVYDAVAIGGTVERLAELTGLPVDDVQMHLDVLIDDGAVVEKPIVIAMSYGVMG